MPLTPEYAAALDALSRAADAMTRTCEEYDRALRAAPPDQRESPWMEALCQACGNARAAHDEALADVWELIEDQPE